MKTIGLVAHDNKKIDMVQFCVKHYKTLGKIKNQLRVTLDEPSNATDQYIILCTFDNAKKNGGKCPISISKGLEKPAYLVEWTRFGNVNKFRWSRNGWTRM